MPLNGRAARACTAAAGLASLATLARPCAGSFQYDQEQRIESARLFGNLNKYAYYFTDIEVGQPSAQRVSVIIDTGSRLVGFPCADCGHCGDHLDPAFDISASRTASWFSCSSGCTQECVEDRCPYSETYAEGSSIGGFWFEDFIKLGDPFNHNPPVKVQMGCHNNEDKLFYTQRANGIMGLAPSSGSISQPTILQQMFQDKKHIDTQVFSICLATWGGRITVGGFNSSYHVDNKPNKEPIRWIDMRASHYYFISPEGLGLVDGKDTIEVVQGAAEFGATIVDSGTTFTYLPESVFTSLMTRLEGYCKGHDGCGADVEDDRCWRVRDVDAGPAQFPPLAMMFSGGVRIEWQPQNYLQQRGDRALWCRTFMANSMFQTVLGISLMLHKDFIFDVGNGKLGIAEAECPEYFEQPSEDEDPGFTPEQKFGSLAPPPVQPRLGSPMSKVVEMPGSGEPEIGTIASRGSGAAAGSSSRRAPTPAQLALPACGVAAAMLVALCAARVKRRATLTTPHSADEETQLMEAVPGHHRAAASWQPAVWNVVA